MRVVVSALVYKDESAGKYFFKNINVLQELWHSQWDKQSNRTVAIHQAGPIKNERP